MRWAFIFGLLFCGGVGSQAAAPSRELIVKFKENARETDVADGLRRGRLNVRRFLRDQPADGRRRARVALTYSEVSMANALELLKNHPAVEFVEPNQIYTHRGISNDPYVVNGTLWGVYGDLSTPANHYGSQAAEAWNSGYVGSSTVFVAVLDQGIDVSHDELAPNIWTNPFDPPDELDNDGNGYIDDLHGWDFLANTNSVFDAAGDAHGTHVAGTIGARGGNGIGIAGVAWNVTIIAGKFIGPESGTTFDAVEGINYFIDLKTRHGLNLVAINASWGGDGYSRLLHEAVIRAAKAGILFIAAAGNNGHDNDTTNSFPANITTLQGTPTESAASYNSVIAVAAIDQAGALASFSNHGANSVHLGAPGVGILSTYPGNVLATSGGTSMAAPHVTGAAALYASSHSGASADQIRSALLSSALPTPSLAGKTTTGGRLNLSTIINAPPDAPAFLLAASPGPARVSGECIVTLSWPVTPNASSYMVLRTAANASPPTVVAADLSTPELIDTVLADGATYRYVVKAVNASGESQPSNPAEITPIPPIPSDVRVSSPRAGELLLGWTDHSSDEQGFKIEYYNGHSWTQLGPAPASEHSVILGGVTASAIHRFRVSAFNQTAQTPYSDTGRIDLP